eukprot:1506922-Lingulodinium_polyedra.AAC.1
MGVMGGVSAWKPLGGLVGSLGRREKQHQPCRRVLARVDLRAPGLCALLAASKACGGHNNLDGCGPLCGVASPCG